MNQSTLTSCLIATIALIHLPPCIASAQQSSTKTYYVGAIELEWDYAPGGINRITGQEPESLEALILTAGDDRIGRIYKKAVYREFTDSTFSTIKDRGDEWEHLGYLGPVLRAAVGDTLRVVFRNMASRPYSMHPHGVFYNKDSEGALYEDGTDGADKRDDAVPPGGTHEYSWPVPERAGPASHDGSSIMWMYHSHVDEPMDVNSGLMGVIIVTRPDMTGPDGRPTDVDREFVVAFAEIDENVSWYVEENIQSYAGKPDQVSRTLDFSELPYLLDLRESVNGRSFGTLEGLRMKMGERVRWYVFATSNFEVHAAHWHGQTAVVNRMRTDVLNLLTMEMATADMVPDNPGTWMLHCHVAPHMMFGMSALFTVE